MTAINLGSKLGENLIINPLLEIWQRGISLTNVASGTYFADRFVLYKAGAINHSIDRIIDSPTLGSMAVYSSLLTVTTALPVLTVGSFTIFSQHIEGYSLRKIKNRNFVFTFKVKASKIGTYCVSLRNASNDKSYVTEYEVTQPNVWEKKTIRVKHDETGSWNYDSASGMKVEWCVASEATYHTPVKDSWEGGNFFATSNQVNGVDTIGNTFQITEVSVVEGLDEIPFDKIMRDFGTELALCQRYFEKTYEHGVKPATPSTSDGAFAWMGVGGTSYNYVMDTFIVTKRVAPTVTCYSTETGNSGYFRGYHGTSGGDYVASATTASTKRVRFQFNAVPSAGYGNTGHWIADAEL